MTLGFQLLNQSYTARYFPASKKRVNAVLHWTLRGAWIGLRLFPNLEPSIQGNFIGVKFNPIEAQKSVSEYAVPDEIINEILQLSSIEPALLSPGRNTLKELSVVRSFDLQRKTGLNFENLQSLLQTKFTTVVLVPHIVLGGADKYTSDIIQMNQSLYPGETLVIATLPHATFDPTSQVGKEYLGFATAKVVFWRDIAASAVDNEVMLARVINAISPQKLIIVNSDIALKMIKRYGLALANRMSIQVAFFNMDIKTFAGQFGIRYARAISKYVEILTDNPVAAKALNTLYLKDFDKKAHIVPSRIHIIEEDAFNLKLRKRISELSHQGSRKRWLWISRLDRYKGTKLLGLIATMRPNDIFDVYGPMGNESLSELGLDKENVNYLGVLPKIDATPTENYVGFLFTSDFEGMPIIVMEMTQHAIPIITTTVGSVDEDFADDEILKVNSQLDFTTKARNFVEKMDEVCSISGPNLEAMLKSAAERVRLNHSEEQVRARFSKIG